VIYLRSDVAFEKGPPAYGARVIETLESLHESVTEILGKFEPEFA
jgi:hypothetical protein